MAGWANAQSALSPWLGLRQGGPTPWLGLRQGGPTPWLGLRQGGTFAKRLGPPGGAAIRRGWALRAGRSLRPRVGRTACGLRPSGGPHLRWGVYAVGPGPVGSVQPLRGWALRGAPSSMGRLRRRPRTRRVRTTPTGLGPPAGPSEAWAFSSAGPVGPVGVIGPFGASGPPAGPLARQRSCLANGRLAYGSFGAFGF